MRGPGTRSWILGSKFSRSPAQERDASTIRSSCRELRKHFLIAHASWLYDLLTEGRTARKGLDRLAFDASERFPGLVPSAAQIADERKRPQSEKEGYDIDQTIFLHGLLHCAGSRSLVPDQYQSDATKVLLNASVEKENIQYEKNLRCLGQLQRASWRLESCRRRKPFVRAHCFTVHIVGAAHRNYPKAKQRLLITAGARAVMGSKWTSQQGPARNGAVSTGVGQSR